MKSNKNPDSHLPSTYLWSYFGKVCAYIRAVLSSSGENFTEKFEVPFRPTCFLLQLILASRISICTLMVDDDG